MEKLSKEFEVNFFTAILMFAAVITLSILSGIKINGSRENGVIASIVFVIVFSVGLVLTVLVFTLPNDTLRKRYGFSAITKTTVNGFALLFPFAILATITDLYFHWNFIQAIVCAAIITCISVIVSDLVKLGGNKNLNFIFSFIAAMAFILLYVAVFAGIQLIKFEFK